MITNDDFGYDHSDVVMLGGHYVTLDNRDLVTIERVRFLKSGRTLEFSYCIGVMSDGTRVRVMLDTQFSTMFALKGDLLAEFKAAGRYAKGMGLFSGSTISIY